MWGPSYVVGYVILIDLIINFLIVNTIRAHQGGYGLPNHSPGNLVFHGGVQGNQKNC